MTDLLTRPLETLRSTSITPLVRHLPPWVTPTGLTLLRLVLVAPLAVLLLKGQWGLALAVYVLAVLTDALDGELARVRGSVSMLGARLDPSVDKVLHIVVYLAFLPAAPMLLLILITLDVFLFLVGLLVVLTRLRPDAPGVKPLGEMAKARAPRSPEGEVGQASAFADRSRLRPTKVGRFRPSPAGETPAGATGVSPWGSTHKGGLPSTAGANVYGKWKFLIQTLGVLLLFFMRLTGTTAFTAVVSLVISIAIIFAVLSMVGYLRQTLDRTSRIL